VFSRSILKKFQKKKTLLYNITTVLFKSCYSYEKGCLKFTREKNKSVYVCVALVNPLLMGPHKCSKEHCGNISGPHEENLKVIQN